jgi:RNA-directed DNA polymerase
MRPGRKLKWHSLIDKVYALPNLEAAWRRVRANKGAPGVDGISIRQFEERAPERLLALQEDLRTKRYRPKPVRRVDIPKAGGGKRPLGIPTVRDRIVQQALSQILGPIFEAVFSKRSHGFRPGRGCATALEVVDRALRYGYTWVVDADIRAFFDSVDHKLLIAALNEEVADGRVLHLIAQILRAGVVEPGVAKIEPTELGTPQGGPLSPLLANVYLHAFDLAMSEAGYGLVRYADDFVIFARSESEANAALTLAREVLEGRLGLHLHPEKTRIVSVETGFEFLGFHYFRSPTKDAQCKEVRHKSVSRFRDAVRGRTPRLHTQRPVKPKHLTLARLVKNRRVAKMVKELNDYLRGWHWYFKSVKPRYNADRPFAKLDYFVRGRVRSAIVGRVGSGWWTVRLTNRLLRGLGLIPLTELHARYRRGLLVQPA